jgi:hypothetical protein
MALDCQMPMLGTDDFDLKEAIMSGAPILAPEAKGVEDWEQWSSPTEARPAWDLESSPRLYEADLADPETFHRRLVDWLMSQK